MPTVGRVADLWRYPVKSMGAERLSSVEVSWAGLAGDRRWAFIQDGQERSGFPWLTIRERNDMWGYQPSYVDPDRPNASTAMVRTPSGSAFEVVDPRLAAELGDGVRVIKQSHGIFDTMPLSVLSVQTVAEVGRQVGRELAPVRFRPNILVDAAESFAEEAWIGHVLRIGAMRMRVDRPDARCLMINVDPTTYERNPAVLRFVAGERGNCLGVYGSTVEPGLVAVGDPVSVED